MKTTVHIINHTHWDREWFLTSIYTSQWIPGLIDKIESLAAENPNFKYLFDGQTLVIEDLLNIAPEYETKVRRLIENDNLIIGPYYCQPDWQLTGGELLIRNLRYGRQDMRQHGGSNHVGWLVDTFGHISQSPQLHRMFGLKAVFVWRGVPQLNPYFQWQGSDGQKLLTINLFGGYRNLYGITHAPEVAITRLVAEVDKLGPYYPTPDIPLFDGYDLEEDPEDPMQFYRQHLSDLPDNIGLQESAPHLFAQTISTNLADAPTLAGELNSGKYGATFPGTFSARTYLKIMQRDCEQWLFQRAEPLAVLARLKGRAYPTQQYEAWARLLLQNSVHDCLCGVSIDQVHEKMEYHYRQVHQAAQEDVQHSLAYILRDFAPGDFAVSTNPLVYDGWLPVGDRLYPIKTSGVGVWPVGEAVPIETVNERVDSFHWQNDHYAATVQPDGSVQLGQAKLGYLVVSDEVGDTYSDELGPRRQICRGEGLVIEQRGEQHVILRYESKLAWDGVEVTATIRLIFDSSPLLRWQVDLASRGTDFRVDMVFETAQAGEIYAGMQFDVVRRPVADTDLLPRQLEPTMA
ncbi:MAG: hypothetical protein R3264_16400, partial [Anaerolineae bacterium]|nr:hypothetical protein [Anaerolineae bacterium]